MSYQATVYRVLIASPSDVADERRAIPEIIQQWNRDNALLSKSVLEAVKWETHCTPEMGDRPQEIVNRQVVRSCDILVGVFWTRLGSSTGRESSGTVEEIREFIAASKPVRLYFSRMPVAPESIDPEQWPKLQAFKKECQSSGLVFLYESIDELRDLLRSHLGRTVEKLKEAAGNEQTATTDPAANIYEQVRQTGALLSLRYDYEIFLSKAKAEWSAERDSEPLSLDDAKLLLRRIADGLIEYRSRIAGDAGQVADLLAEATKQLKSLQRHDVFLDGGASYREFWLRGDEILFLLEIVATSLDDALQGKETAIERNSARRAAEEEIEFNEPHLGRQEYSTPSVLRTESVGKLVETDPKLPERLVGNLRNYVQNIRAARDVHALMHGAAGDFLPEQLRIEALLKSALEAGKVAIVDLRVALRYLTRSTPS